MYIELPFEDPMSEGGNMVSKLDKALYGTRDALAAWQAELEKTMTSFVHSLPVLSPVVENSCCGTCG